MSYAAKTLLIFLALSALLYVALCALLYAKQRALIYFPEMTRVAVIQTDISVDRNDVVLRGWVVNPGQPGAILYFGGNGESVEMNRGDFAVHFPEFSTYLLAYRGYGASDGQPNQDALFADALAIYDHVRQRHPEGPIAVIGRSLGSGVASYLASQRPVDRLVLVTPFDSLANIGQTHYPLFPVRWLVRDRYESFRYLPQHSGPLMVIRAPNDAVIPARHTDRLIAGLPRKPEIVAFPQADHNNLSNDPRYWRSLRAFVQPATVGVN
ncbi:alpha/beta hydrolase [Pseudoxanthomonas sp. UTMC 1351]|uniref:alpha/beta hydrolase n=1 Tax=Pseudoxanthomonas sp. UTMC 1351 TaxID=2695853 RepID=UPI0034CDF586